MGPSPGFRASRDAKIVGMTVLPGIGITCIWLSKMYIQEKSALGMKDDMVCLGMVSRSKQEMNESS
jgi:hypothetical protein